MRKYVLSFVLLLVSVIAMGQKKSLVILVKSENSTGIKLNGKDVIKVYRGTFRQDYSTLSSDSAYFYPDENAFDAYGHVVINQGDTVNIYADKLNYNGNTKVAILTDNVKLVDKDATLTTNHLNYNTATRIGTYTDGGKLVNKDNTLLSKNGYYFAFTRDSYFRYNVSLTTPDALVITDTMRYNTKSRISYFYGPTHIYSTKGEKDRDTLYTENGQYNTQTQQGAFGKNNLYNSGTKSLKGDSLFYDKLKGYGRAVKHVTFHDKEQNVTIKGNLGTYFKEEEHTIVTQDPYIIMVTEEKDTTKTDSAAKADSLAKLHPAQKSGVMNMKELIKKTIPGKTDTAAAKNMLSKAGTTLKIQPSKADSAAVKRVVSKIDTVLKTVAGKIDTAAIKRKVSGGVPVTKKPGGKPNSKSTPVKKPAAAKKPAKGAAANKETVPEKKTAPKDTSKLKHDSVYMSADTIETRILTYKDLKAYFEKQRLAHVRDTTSKPKPKLKEKPSKYLTASQAGLSKDTVFRLRDFFGRPPVKKKVIKPKTKKELEQDSLKNKMHVDSLLKAKLAEPSDTARIRIIIAYHDAKMFKSDLQGKADSMFYSNADSTIRCFVKPMMWTQGSQLSGDTIYLQMKHKKFDNMTMFPNAFIVNVEKDDSTHFNQVGGKRMRGFFKDDKLNRMFIEGNAESIYFSRDSGKTTINGMQRSLSTSIHATFKNNQVTNMGFYTKPDNRYIPIAKVKDDDKILKGFIWKPKDRPVSKESVIPSYNKKREPKKAPPDKSKTGKPTLKKGPDGKMIKDTTGVKPPGKLPGLTAPKDSTLKKDTVKVPPLKTGTGTPLKVDTVKTPGVKAKKDSVIAKPVPVPKPVVKAEE